MSENGRGGEKENRVFARAMDAALLFMQLQAVGATVFQVAEEGVFGSEVGREWREKYGGEEEVWRLMFELLEGIPYPSDGDLRAPYPRVPDTNEEPYRLRRWAEELEEQVEEALALVQHDPRSAAACMAERNFCRAEMMASEVALRAHEERLPNTSALAGYAAAIHQGRNKLLEAFESR